MSKIKIFIIVLLFNFLLASAGDDEFIEGYSGDDELMGTYFSGDDEFNYFELTEGAVEPGSSGGATGGDIGLIFKGSGDCLTSHKNSTSIVAKGTTKQNSFLINNSCNINFTQSINCYSFVCQYLEYPLNITILENGIYEFFYNVTLPIDTSFESVAGLLQGTAWGVYVTVYSQEVDEKKELRERLNTLSKNKLNNWMNTLKEYLSIRRNKFILSGILVGIIGSIFIVWNWNSLVGKNEIKK